MTVYGRSLALVFCLLCLSALGMSQDRPLDGFDTLSGWQTIVSEGASLTLSSGNRKAGRCMMMDFNLGGVYGYAIAEKEFCIDLPLNYQFTFDLCADAQVNCFGFKIIDRRNDVYWIKKLNITSPREWTKQRIKKRQLPFAWGPAPGLGLLSARKMQFAVSSGPGGRGGGFLLTTSGLSPSIILQGASRRAGAESPHPERVSYL